MSEDIRSIGTINRLITYFSKVLDWQIDEDDFEDIEDISYDFEAEDLGLKEEAFAKIKSLRQLQPLVDGQKWGIFSIEFDSKKFEVTALRKVLSGLIPKKRNSADHAVWDQKDLLFLCFWGEDSNRTIGIAHFEDKEKGLPQIKMIYCAPAIEDTMQIKQFEVKLKNLTWPIDVNDVQKWHDDWSNAFSTGYRQIIHDASTLTLQLAVEARGIRDRILETLEVETDNGYVHQLYAKFKDTLIHDMTEVQFADMYAQTVVYGLFSARCMDESQDDFSAAEAVECIPNTNPFLKSLMKECLGAQSNSKLSYDELEIGNVVDLLLHTKTSSIIQDFNRQTGGGREDPVIHFYEEFLTAYDKSQKVQRGVYYTPQPIVRFIVRAVDAIIKTDFGVSDGLASTETKKIKYMRDSKKKKDGYFRTKVEDVKDVPYVQLLDPSTGTGTFLRQTILQIYENFKEMNNGLDDVELKKRWNEYVPKYLLPRINGFELMMAPYAVAHMKLAMVLKDTGYEFGSSERLNVYLTNTLEEPGNSDGQLSLFDDPLASESIAANAVKKNNGINVFIGNPPYSSESANNGTWIQQLMNDFKKEPHSENRLQEQNYKAINDDYVKFIRFTLECLKESNNGIFAFINPHGFIDNPTFRGMRWKLMQALSKIYIIELHGDYRRKETCPDGSKDENVFDIQQGVCILIGIKGEQKSGDCKIYRTDVYGTRNVKYDWLNKADFINISWNEISNSEPYYFFAERETENLKDYDKGFSVKELFCEDVMGVATARDAIVVDANKEKLKIRFDRIADETISDLIIAQELFGEKAKEYVEGPVHGWVLSDARKSIYGKDIAALIHPVSYRPFDKRFIFYTPEWIDRGRESVMKHFYSGENYGLCTIRINRDDMCTVFVSDSITDKTILSSKDNANVFPLYLYKNDSFIDGVKSNFNMAIIKNVEESIKRKFKADDTDSKDTFDAYELFCYVYAILHSPSYREKYSDLLKSEFPKIPYPVSNEMFCQFAKYGDELIKLHLMRFKRGIGTEHKFSGLGDNVIVKAEHKNNCIYINKTQMFTNVDANIWNCYIAAYQPLQKWMKDRKGLTLTEEDVMHYQDMIEAISKTMKIMQEINSIYQW